MFALSRILSTFRTILCGLAVMIGGLSASSAMAGDELAVYHIGNSLTGDLVSVFPKLASKEAKADGRDYRWGLHFRPATSLFFMYRNPLDAKTASIVATGDQGHRWKKAADEGFMPWTKALPGNYWDVVTLQVWQDDAKATLKDDTETVNAIIAATRVRADNASTRFFIYAPWTMARFNEPESFKNAFTAPTPDDPKTPGVATRDYFRHVCDAVQKTNPDVALIPSGEVLLALDEKMRAGRFEQFTSVQQLHRDVIHLNSIGCNVTAWTAYAVIFKKSPVGLPNDPHPGKEYPPFKNVVEGSPADLKLMQETVWEVVMSAELRSRTKVQ